MLNSAATIFAMRANCRIHRRADLCAVATELTDAGIRIRSDVPATNYQKRQSRHGRNETDLGGVADCDAWPFLTVNNGQFDYVLQVGDLKINAGRPLTRNGSRLDIVCLSALENCTWLHGVRFLPAHPLGQLAQQQSALAGPGLRCDRHKPPSSWLNGGYTRI
jgi:hypothetical protein